MSAMVGASNIARWNLDPHFSCNARHQPDRRQGLPAQIEKSVIDADRAPQSQNFGELR